MKTLLIVVTSIFLSIFHCVSQDNQGKYKYWHQDSILTWNDFQGPIAKKSNHFASSNCNIQYYFDIREDTILFEVKVFFDKSRSWKEKSKITMELLEHEQGHFMVAELYARKLRKALMTFPIPHRHLTDSVKSIYSSTIDQYKMAQFNYDIETKWGTDYKTQQEILKAMDEKLKKYHMYRKITYKRTMH